jgi:hypothetical protein
LVLGLVVALPSAGYLGWLLHWLGGRHPLPGWLLPLGTLAGFAFVLAAVFVIAKTHAWSQPQQRVEVDS